MNRSFVRRAAALLAVSALALTLTACFETPSIVITDEQGTTTTAADTTQTTVPVPKGQMTLASVMAVMSPTMRWSTLQVYTHTDVDDSHATFAVADGLGKECILSVTYDAASDTVKEALLSYGDTTVDILSDNTLVIRRIMIAMNED